MTQQYMCYLLHALLCVLPALQVRAFFMASAERSDLFAHRLLWALSSEQRPPEEAFSPSGAKRSGRGSR